MQENTFKRNQAGFSSFFGDFLGSPHGPKNRTFEQKIEVSTLRFSSKPIQWRPKIEVPPQKIQFCPEKNPSLSKFCLEVARVKEMIIGATRDVAEEEKKLAEILGSDPQQNVKIIPKN